MILDSDLITVGEQDYAGLATIDGLVYISDGNTTLIEFDGITDTVTNTLDLEAINGAVSSRLEVLSGIRGPDALINIDFGNSVVSEINPTTGVITNSFAVTPTSGFRAWRRSDQW